MSKRLSILAALLAMCATVRGGHLWLSVMDDSLAGTMAAWNPTCHWLPKLYGNACVNSGVGPTNTATVPSIGADGWEFSGDKYLDYGTPEALEVGTNSFTMSIWVNSYRATNYMVIGRGYFAGGDRWFMFSYTNFYAAAHRGTTAVTVRDAQGGTVSPSNWYLVSSVIDKTSGGYCVRLYVDGELVSTSTTNTSSVTAITFANPVAGVPFRIGAYGNSAGVPTYFGYGRIIEAAVWKRIVTDEEQAAMFEATRTGKK